MCLPDYLSAESQVDGSVFGGREQLLRKLPIVALILIVVIPARKLERDREKESFHYHLSPHPRTKMAHKIHSNVCHNFREAKEPF